MEKIIFKGHYIQGKFQNEGFSKLKTRKSPSGFEDEIIDFPQKFSLPPLVCQQGKEAHLLWSQKSLKTRKEILSPLKQIFEKKKSLLSEIISRETGKPLWESEMEIQAVLRKIDITFKEGVTRIEQQELQNDEGSFVGRVRFKSRGLLLVIGPFNFPIHLPFSQILAALVAGNSVIFKPSEKTPASCQLFVECLDCLDLPPGVFQMVQGTAKVSQKLAEDSLVDGILFTGSFEVGQKIKEATVKDYWKLLALEMGGYNTSLIWEDYSKEQAILETLKSCFWTAGQRCSSTSQILVHKKVAQDFIGDFIKEVQKLKVGHWKDNPFMGSLIDKTSVQKFFRFQKEVEKKGVQILTKGQELSDKGYYVSPGVYQVDSSQAFSIGHQELFTPQVLIYEVNSLEEALKMIHHSGYGLVLAAFTQNPEIRKELFYRAQVGLINYNKSSCGASSYLPFGGLGKSGNHRPAASWMIDSCVNPVAEQEGRV
ncbi:MAG: aldehyde dehydrogenase family protein [Bdellovibrionales bacterium]